MANIYNQYVAKLDGFLHENNKVAEILEKIEKSTGVKRIYIAQGVLGFTALYLIVGHFAAFICNVIGFLYPAYASISALESSSKDDDSKWLMYWVVFAAFSVFEFFSDIIFSWFPFYWLFKVCFLVWCFAPIASNGSEVIYRRFIRPVFVKNREQIDRVMNTAVDNITSRVMDQAKERLSKQE